MYKFVGLWPDWPFSFKRIGDEGVKISCKTDCYGLCDADTVEQLPPCQVSRKSDRSSFHAHHWTKVYSGSRFSICSCLDLLMFHPLTAKYQGVEISCNFIVFVLFTATCKPSQHWGICGLVARCVLSLRRTLTISLLLLWVLCQPENQAGQGIVSLQEPAATEPLQMYLIKSFFGALVLTSLDWPTAMFLPYKSWSDIGPSCRVRPFWKPLCISAVGRGQRRDCGADVSGVVGADLHMWPGPQKLWRHELKLKSWCEIWDEDLKLKVEPIGHLGENLHSYIQ